MKRTSLKPFLWLTALVGCSNLLTVPVQPVSGQTNSSVLLAQRISQPQDIAQFNSTFKELEDAPPKFQALEEVAQILKELEEIVQKLELAVYFLRESKFENEAIPLAERSLEIREIIQGENGLDVAMSLNNLGLLYLLQGRFDEAEPLLQRSLVLEEKYQRSWVVTGGGGTLHFPPPVSLDNLGLLYLLQGRFDEAEPLLQRSLAISEALGENHPHVATSLNNLAGLYHSQGDTTQAINFLSRGLEIEEKNLKFFLATGSEHQKQDSMKKVLGTTYQAISLHIKDAPNNSEAARLALTTLLRRKGRILDVMTNELQLLRENLTPENQKFLDELASARTQLATMIYNKPDNLPQEKYRQQVDILRKKAENLEAELSRRSTEFRRISEPITIEAVQQFIPKDTALVEFVLYKPLNAKEVRENRFGKPHYAAYILKSSGEPQWVDLGEAEAIHEAYYERRGFGQNLVLKAPPALMKKSAWRLDSLRK